MHIEARSKDAEIYVGETTFINNNAVIIAEKASITIGARCFIGTDFHCVSSDFHGLDPHRRENYKSASVHIGDDVFIGNNVTILKGVTIGGGGNNCSRSRRHERRPRKCRCRRQSRETHKNSAS